MKQITEKQIHDYAIREYDSAPYLQYVAGKAIAWALGKMQPEWIKINNESDLPKVSGDYHILPSKQVRHFSVNPSHDENYYFWLKYVDWYTPVISPEPPKQ